MRILCPHCEQVFLANQPAGAAETLCPECGRGVGLPGQVRSAKPALVPGQPANPIARWLGFALIACVILASGAARWFYLGHVQQWVLARTLPALEADAFRVRDWYCTRALAGPDGSVMMLSDREAARGYVYLVLELEIASQWAEPTDPDATNPNAVGDLRAASSWFKLVGPQHSLIRARGMRRTDGAFVETHPWPGLPNRNGDTVRTTVFFKVHQSIAEADRLGLVFRWHRPRPLTQALHASARTWR